MTERCRLCRRLLDPAPVGRPPVVCPEHRTAWLNMHRRRRAKVREALEHLQRAREALAALGPLPPTVAGRLDPVPALVRDLYAEPTAQQVRAWRRFHAGG